LYEVLLFFEPARHVPCQLCLTSLYVFALRVNKMMMMMMILKPASDDRQSWPTLVRVV